MRRAIRLWLMVSLAGMVLVPLMACDTVYDANAVAKYTEIRGLIRIPGELSPLLPTLAAEGAQVPGGEPGNCWDEPAILPTIVSDEPALMVKGELSTIYAGGVCDDPGTVWYQFQVNKKASLTVHCDWENAGQDGFVAALYSRPAGSSGPPDFIVWDLSGIAPITITLVADPGKEYFLRWLKWYETPTPTKYTLALSAISGTVVGRIMIGAYPDPVPHIIVPGEYASDADDLGSASAGLAKHPVGGTTVVDLAVDPVTGDMTGWYDGLLIPVKKCKEDADCVCGAAGEFVDGQVCSPTTCNTEQGYCQYWVFAFADNDGGNTLNFSTMGVPTSADFVMHETVPMPGGGVDFTKGWLLYTMSELLIDTEVTDADFDGILDGDNDGDGLPDDNCPTTYNTDQVDSDGDGVGDMCDNCRDVPNPDQANWDGIGPGDACNGYADADGDDVEHRPDDSEDVGDNCPEVANPYQDDLDNDGLGDECDPDIDNDGIANDAPDNCPLAGNADQADGDSDGAGDACDNCRGNMSTCLAGGPVADETFDTPRDEWDAAWIACENKATVACGECGALLTSCLATACSDCGGDDCFAYANCAESEVTACENGLDRCIARCDMFPADLDEEQQDCYDKCDSDRDKCVDKGPCSRKKYDKCTTCQDVCTGMCGSYDAFCTATCATCAGDSCEEGNADQTDNDGDGAGDACDTDDDDDGIDDGDDPCPFVYNGEADGDGDGIPDDCDVCPLQFDPAQTDTDEDGVGDLCDNCRLIPNGWGCDIEGNESRCDVDGDEEVTDYEKSLGNQANSDDPAVCDVEDGCIPDDLGDACDDDLDGDGVDDDDDNCSMVFNPRPACGEHADCVGASGICDVEAGFCNGQPDSEKDAEGNPTPDGIGDACDNCHAANPGQADMDGDGVGDDCDNCPMVYNPNPACEKNDDDEEIDDGWIDAECFGAGDICVKDPENPESGTCISQRNTDRPPVLDKECSGPFDCGSGYVCNDDVCKPRCDGDFVCPYGFICEGGTVCEPDQAMAWDDLGDACDPDDDGDDFCDPGVVNDVCSGADNCPVYFNPDQGDRDGNGIGDACDLDGDEDGVQDYGDNCPETPNGPGCEIEGNELRCDVDGDEEVTEYEMSLGDQKDTDGDGIGDACDVCPGTADDGSDSDGDGLGDACDLCPDDADGRCESDADCVNAGTCDILFGRCTQQLNTDAPGDDLPDACDWDDDNDGVADDGDGSGDTTDNPCSSGETVFCDDNCRLSPNADQVDGDSDGVGDTCDNCTAVPNGLRCDEEDYESHCDVDGDGDTTDYEKSVGGQIDRNGNGVGDACDADADGDGIDNADDNCPLVVNPKPTCTEDGECVGAGDVCDNDTCTEQLDSDGNGIGDACEEGEVVTEFFEEEPNDLFQGDAHDLRPYGLISMGYDYRVTGYAEAADAAGGDQDEDFYLIEFAQAGSVMIVLDWQVPDADYDMVVWFEDPPGSGSLYAPGAGYMGAYIYKPEVAILDVEPGLMYALNVTGYDGGPGVYTLSFNYMYERETEPNDWNDAGTGEALPGQPNDCGTLALTYELDDYPPDGQPTKGAMHLLGTLTDVSNDGSIWLGDYDSFAFVAEVSGPMNIVFDWAVETADYDLFLLDLDVGYVATSFADKPEVILDYPAEAGHLYVIQVAGFDGDAGDYECYVTLTAN